MLKPDAKLATPTDLSSNATKGVADVLKTILADTFALYLKTKSYHWHLKGPRFRDLHLLFDEQAAAILAVTDPMAERVRKQDGATLTSIGAIGRASVMCRLKPFPSSTSIARLIASRSPPVSMVMRVGIVASSPRQVRGVGSNENDVTRTAAGSLISTVFSS